MKTDRRSLYEKIDQFMADHLKGIKNNNHYPTAARKAGAYYAMSNALGMIRALKGDMDLKRKRKSHENR